MVRRLASAMTSAMPGQRSEASIAQTRAPASGASMKTERSSRSGVIARGAGQDRRPIQRIEPARGPVAPARWSMRVSGGRQVRVAAWRGV